jgi:hypothetical protein
VGAPAQGACVRSRGNFDCPSGQQCSDDGDGDDDGVCEGGAGDGGTLDECDDDDDCDGGLCEDDVCTRPCDFGCPFGTRCDDDEIAGGLCVLDDDEVCR